MTDNSFAELQLLEPILHALRDQGYESATPIQAQAIPVLLEGRDLLGIAQTGSGKTAAFALPILDHLAREERRASPRRPRALVLSPTRELASQIGQSFASYGRNLRLNHTVIFGGVKQIHQVRALRRGVDILVATPGRLMDLIAQRHVDLSDVGVFVLDEADQMMDMGFIRDVRRIAQDLPRERQSLLFSATMPDAIAQLTESLLTNPQRVEVSPPSTTVERIEQQVYFVEKSNKRLLLDRILLDDALDRVLVFTRTKHGADRVAKHLDRQNEAVGVIHGNKTQNVRERVLRQFRAGQLRILVATDVAARGIDIDGVTHVVNFDLPNVPESYVHRIGRTARAGKDGIAISFCDGEERAYLRDIERTIRDQVPVMEDHPWAMPTPRRSQPGSSDSGQGGGRNSNRNRNSGRNRNSTRSRTRPGGDDRNSNRDRSGGQGRSTRRDRNSSQDRFGNGDRSPNRDRNPNRDSNRDSNQDRNRSASSDRSANRDRHPDQGRDANRDRNANSDRNANRDSNQDRGQNRSSGGSSNSRPVTRRKPASRGRRRGQTFSASRG